MQKDYYLLVNSKVLPPVFKSVIEAKELLRGGQAQSTSDAVKKIGLSRSAFYKYKDYVFKYESSDPEELTISAVLFDRAGVLAALTGTLSEFGVNIITVNQNAPKSGKAAVTITARTDSAKIAVSDLMDKLKAVDGVVSIKEDKII